MFLLKNAVTKCYGYNVGVTKYVLEHVHYEMHKLQHLSVDGGNTYWYSLTNLRCSIKFLYAIQFTAAFVF